MNKHLQELVELSKIDRSVDSFTPQEEAAHKKIARAQAKVDDVAEKIETIQKVVESNSEKSAAYEEQITTLNEQLKSIQKKNKAVTNEREMKALSLEEELAKEKLTFANEEIARLDKVNGVKSSDLEELKSSLEELDAKLAEVTTVAQKELDAIEKQKSSLYADRTKRVSLIDQKILAFYEKVRRWAGNTAVVAVKNQACYGCYMKINDKSYSEVIKAEEITGCPHCGRILYLEREEPQE